MVELKEPGDAALNVGVQEREEARIILRFRVLSKWAEVVLFTQGTGENISALATVRVCVIWHVSKWPPCSLVFEEN